MGPPAATNGDDPKCPRRPELRPSSAELPEFAEAVLHLVDQIPPGMVLSYGDVAEMLEQGGPRQVGSVMSRYGSSVTWWRVIRASGEAPQGLHDEALARWRTEGTALVRGALAEHRVDMTRARWDPQGSQSPGARPHGAAATH